MLGDLEVLKEIPGYKAILKSVLKSQIQMLVEQLSEHTGEETILLTASLHDGTLSHQGSTTGKGFLEGRDEIKSQFLGYCLKSHHKKKSTDTRPSPYQRPQTSGRISPALGSPSKKAPRLQVQPVSLQRVVPAENTGTPNSNKRPADVQGAPSQVFTSDSSAEQSSVSVKLESNESGVSSGDSENLTTTATFPSSIHQNHTLTAGEISASENNDSQNNADDYTEISTMNDDSSTANTCIKIEPITENEMELEITGVEPGKVSMQSDSWSHSPSGFGITPTSVVEASSFSNETNDSSYSDISQPQYHPVQLISYPPQSAGEPVIFFQPITGKAQNITPPSCHAVSMSQDLTINQPSFTTMLTSFDITAGVDTSPDMPSTSTTNQSKSTLFPASKSKPPTLGFNPTPIPLTGKERIVIPASTDDQFLPFTKENYGKEKDKWVLKRYICQYCGKRCMKPSDLTRHIKIHTGEYPYECSVCSKRFREKFNLNAHHKKGNCQSS